MKRKFGLLALLSLLLMAVVPSSTALAAQPVPFSAFGSIATIDAGDVSAAGASTRFVVKERSVGGFLGGPDLLGPYTLTFGTNVPILTQSGQFHGILEIPNGGYKASVRGASSLGLTPVGYPGLLIDGTLTFTKGTQGHGEIHGWLIPAIDPVTGHILYIIAGAINVSGQWQS